MRRLRGANILGVVALVGVISVGCGGAHPGATGHSTPAPARSASHPGSQPLLTLLRTDGISIRVPQGWHLGQQVTVSKTRATGLNAGLLVPQLPKNTAALTRDPRNRSPYFTETIETAGHTAYGALYELSTAGNYYNIQLQVPRSAVDALRRALRTVTLPPVATVTQAVTLMEHRATVGSQLWLANTGAANTKWVLVGGAVATAQEPFYLFRTADGGKHWSLINYTSTPQHIFPDLAGSQVMLFGSADDGVIAEVTGFSTDVSIYNTHDGGQSWAVQQLALPGPPNAQTTPQLVDPFLSDNPLCVASNGSAKPCYVSVIVVST